MNTLSVLIYLAGVAQTLTVVLGVAIAAAAVTLFVAVMISTNTYSINQQENANKWRNRAIWSLIVLLPLLSITPSRQTVLLITASEMGERLVTSDAVGQIADPSMRLVQVWIQRETDRLLAESANSGNRR
jgi:Mn2+/Fe2+ NRAMP family transporter